jgi:anti-sigma factor RsiW
MSGRAFVEEAVHGYLDGRLSPAERERFKHALERDPALREEVRALREVDQALGLLPGHAAPSGFTARVARAARRRRGGLLRLVLPLAAAAAAALVAISLGGNGTSPPKPSPPAEEEVRYVWESDVETYGSLALTDLEDQILAELEGS